jgi:hypothetical protein
MSGPASAFEQTGSSAGHFFICTFAPIGLGMTGSVPLGCVMFGGSLSALGACGVLAPNEPSRVDFGRSQTGAPTAK